MPQIACLSPSPSARMTISMRSGTFFIFPPLVCKIYDFCLAGRKNHFRSRRPIAKVVFSASLGKKNVYATRGQGEPSPSAWVAFYTCSELANSLPSCVIYYNYKHLQNYSQERFEDLKFSLKIALTFKRKKITRPTFKLFRLHDFF